MLALPLPLAHILPALLSLAPLPLDALIPALALPRHAPRGHVAVLPPVRRLLLQVRAWTSTSALPLGLGLGLQFRPTRPVLLPMVGTGLGVLVVGHEGRVGGVIGLSYSPFLPVLLPLLSVFFLECYSVCGLSYWRR